MNGVINLLKPPGMSSSDAVVHVRKLLGIKKIGHAGTLDPLASGVLILCLNKATRLSDYYMSRNKTYNCGMVLGIETDTLDGDGEIINRSSNLPDANEIFEAFKKFKGKLFQEPPMYSAIKYKGRKLYELARKGQTVDVKSREIEIFSSDILRYNEPDELVFEVVSSKGTYIRSLVRDIGRELSCGAYLNHLVRTASGSFKLEDSVTFKDIENARDNNNLEDIIIPMDRDLDEMDSLVIEKDMFLRLKNGNLVHEKHIINEYNKSSESEFYRIYCDDIFIGLAYIDELNRIRMRKVLV